MRYLALVAGLALSLSGAAFAQDAQDHAAHHPDDAAAAPAPATPPPAAPQGQAQTGPTVPAAMIGCPMMNGGNAGAKPDPATLGPQMGMANGQMGCPMMQGQGGVMMQGQDRAQPQVPAKGS